MGCESHTELFCFDFIDWAFNNGVGSRFAIRKLDLPRLLFGTSKWDLFVESLYMSDIGIAVLRVHMLCSFLTNIPASLTIFPN